MPANLKSRKGLAYTKIHISEKHTGEDHRIRPLTRAEVKARLDWYGSMVPWVGDTNPVWKKWAFKRMDELNERLRMTHNGQNQCPA